MTDFPSTCSDLKISPPPEWGAQWNRSDLFFDRQPLKIFTSSGMDEICQKMSFSEPIRQLFLDLIPYLQNTISIRRLIAHAYWVLYESKLDPQIHTWPTIPAETHSAGPWWTALALLAGLSHTQQIHRTRGISEVISRDTLSDMELWIREHHRRHQRWGFSETNWLFYHFSGKLIKLGRLQYVVDRWPHPFHVWQHRITGEKVVLIKKDCSLRYDGQFASADGGREKQDLWTSEYTVTETEIQGHPTLPTGCLSRSKQTLQCDEWKEVLTQDDPVFSVHISASGPMDIHACVESIQRAFTDLSLYFPEHPYRALTCCSWLLDPQFKTLLPSTSNIVKFLDLWKLHPVEKANSNQTYERVFDCLNGHPPDLQRLPQSSLQKSLLTFIKNGGQCRQGAGILFPNP